MEYLAGFVFTLFKIAVQAGVYAPVLRWLLGRLAAHRLVAAHRLARLAKRINYDGWHLWRILFGGVYAALFLFSCTYWGDHGLGDSARLPLGYGEEMAEINGTETYFAAAVPFKVADMAGAQDITKFKVVKDILCAQAEETHYFTYN